MYFIVFKYSVAIKYTFTYLNEHKQLSGLIKELHYVVLCSSKGLG